MAPSIESAHRHLRWAGPHTAGDVGPDQIDVKKAPVGPTPVRSQRGRSTPRKAPLLKLEEEMEKPRLPNHGQEDDGERQEPAAGCSLLGSAGQPLAAHEDHRGVDKWHGICCLGMRAVAG
eukprot:TRINITY_DN19984_c3_g1_i1.p3 TRINITY_DN19984_c3_g1~~TRINITY_DN19984_c3_g1_i1.p3  ORF type:complete len:120 (-),score=28.13 TRINITY_DN19984_c3_g1_i1:860-1219(-)